MDKEELPQGVPTVQHLVDISEDHLTDAMESAAASGQLETFNHLLQQAKNRGISTKDFLNESLKSAVDGYWSKRVNEERRQQIRNVINLLLNMNDGPNPITVFRAFGEAVSSSVNRDLSLLREMLLDRNTGQLRTGLRPTNDTIRYLGNEIFHTDENMGHFLCSFDL